MIDLLKKVQRNAADYGYTRCSVKIVRRLIRPIYQGLTYRVYGLDVQGAEVPKTGRDDRFLFRQLTKSDCDAIEQVEGMAEWLAGKVRDRIEMESICMVAMEGAQVVAFNLVSTGTVEIPIVSLRWNFNSTEMWSEHIATQRHYRKLGLATRIRYHVIKELKQRGIEWFYGGTLMDHPGTLKLASRIGFVEVGDLCYRRILTSRAWEMKRFVNENTRRIAPPFDSLDQFSTNELSLQSTAHHT